LAWTISYTDTARNELRKLDKQTARRILDFLDDRIAGTASPRDTGKALTGPLLGTFWRYRVGDYRIVCEIQDGKLCVLVIEIGHRREVYK
jgi:mRNA interferase RelE/StbE